MGDPHTTKQAKKLYNALLEQGLEAKIEFWDKHKHVDISILEARLYIEVEGDPHFLWSSTILSDFERDRYSTEDGFDTFRVPNYYIDHKLEKLVKAIKKPTSFNSILSS